PSAYVMLGGHLAHFSIGRYALESPLFPYTTLFRSAVRRTDPGWPRQRGRVRRPLARHESRVRLGGGCRGWKSTATAAESDSTFVDRKSTRLNSSHQIISYYVFCLKKKTDKNRHMSR